MPEGEIATVKSKLIIRLPGSGTHRQSMYLYPGPADAALHTFCFSRTRRSFFTRDAVESVPVLGWHALAFSSGLSS